MSDDYARGVHREREQWINATNAALEKLSGTKNTIEIAKAAIRGVLHERRALLAKEQEERRS